MRGVMGRAMLMTEIRRLSRQGLQIRLSRIQISDGERLARHMERNEPVARVQLGAYCTTTSTFPCTYYYLLPRVDVKNPSSLYISGRFMSVQTRTCVLLYQEPLLTCQVRNLGFIRGRSLRSTT